MFEAKAQAVYYRVTEKGIESVDSCVIGESRWALYVNDQEVVTFMATSRDLHHLALGFLASEDLIAGLDDIASVRVNLASDCAYWFIPALGLNETRSMPVCEDGVGSIQVRLTHETFHLPTRRTITSGCGGGVTFADLTKEQSPIESSVKVRPAQIFKMMHELIANATLYHECRGVHTSALATADHLLAIAEDVGRHNTIDKLRGYCLMQGIGTRDAMLLSTGRISSEMITKASKMQTPIVVSRTSPTELAVELAKAWNITLIGYAHAGQMQVYSGLERIDVEQI